MSTMAIPPFPPLDLAKLVLGYLAEEQLMTAYDEFLQASPYLDALRNEYDRIFMTSLKNILAEYRAVKIYVETCKPFALRRKLFQCTNLLDVVKFLINHVDVNKIQSQDNNSFRNSSDKQNASSRLNVCEVCESSKLTNCACKTRQAVLQVPATSTHSASNSELSVRESSVETTALSDLPGNHVPTRKKLAKSLDKDSSMSHSKSGYGQDTSIKQTTCVFSNVAEDQSSPLTRHDNMLQNIQVLPKVTDESQEKIKEFNDILHLVCNKNKSKMQQGNVDRSVSNAGTFQDFATGMIGDNRNINVPDCSNSENVNTIVPEAKDKKSSTTTKKTRRVKKSQILVVANLSETLKQPSEVIDVDAIDDQDTSQIRPKVDQSKIKILSDVKVGNETLNNNLNAVLQNATSTPLLKMQTVVINGTPVYKPVTGFTNQGYTKDEIMAMPTIIVTPLTGPPPTTVSEQSHEVTPSQQATAPSLPEPIHHIPEYIPVPNSVSGRSLGPLLIEVSSHDIYTLKQAVEVANNANLVQQKPVDQGLITTVNSSNLVNTVSDAGKSADAVSASVPKDNVIASGTETSTPQVLPPTRKSSSTPRRTSHVRVLDFTTPRRILHETINEVPNSNTAEVVLSKSPNVVIPNTNLINDNANSDVKDTFDDGQKQTSKENNNSNLPANKKDWDSDLRALVGGSANNKNKSKPKASRKKKVEVEPKRDDDKDISSKKKTKPRKTKKEKNEISTDSKIKDVDKISDQTLQKVDIPKKPTIHIISGQDWEVSHHEAEKVQNKSNNDEHDTPDLERLCLDEKTMGARLNLSDLLETPYKQALYDIQMETPRFLGPDLPGDPPSDIKITNIPTPRFLNSPKCVQATPSYSSRPTDYSSGGSYYKPDDQDYMPLPDQIGYPASSSQENINNKLPDEGIEMQENENKSKSSRPVRQCAKNVSYFNHQITKTKEDSTKAPNDSIREGSLSDSSFEHRSPEKKKNKENTSKKVKENTPRMKTKSDKRRKSISNKFKSPLKKEVSKSFMKIRPRRSTPLKDSKGERSRRRASEVPTPKSQTKKRTNSKERNIHAIHAPVAVPTKSRRKSSTPRKLHCTKSFNSESSGHNSPDIINKDKQLADLPQEAELQSAHDSDTEQLKLRWSDDGSQDAKPKASQDSVANDSEDISKIQEYIKTTIGSKPVTSESEGSLHIDLVKRGFDVETAKIIERDLLDTPPHPKQDNFVPKSLQSESKNEEAVLEKTIESESSISNNLQIVQDEQQDEEEEEVEEIELSVHECDKDSSNYFTFYHDDNVDTSKAEPVKLKDKFCMEVCIDDGVSIRLRATQCTPLFDLNPDEGKYDDPQDIEETQRAVSTIKFQTPLKDRIKAQCFEIFDSTLTSLDTPLKVDTPRRPDPEVTVTEIVLEVENVEMKDKADSKKRKRVHSGNLSDDSGAENKKSKSEPQYMLNSTNIQNIDIESVLSKLHGP